jgi:hypothetical protein
LDDQKAQHKDFEALAWGLLFIWWGFTELVDLLPKGGGWVGVGLILLGVNLAMSLKGMRLDGFSILFGLIAYVVGGRELARSTASQPLVLSGLAIVLIGLGALMMAPELRRD